ncbi:MAG: polysaccharide deacetylase family protein [Alistipes sp.]|nr:polysaccharide deacetylase family protein [Alistipes sp.]
MFIEQPPHWVRKIMANKAYWRIPAAPKVVYLTFDDGPTPEVTPWVLDLLDRYDVKATFFCVGDNVARYRSVFEQVKARGHMVGNHTMNHINALNYHRRGYLANVEKAASLIGSVLFRPPHGWIRHRQAKLLRRKYKIVMWDVVTRDYSNRQNAMQVVANVKRYTRNGSIITFHDTSKSWHNLELALPLSLEWLIEQGYEFRLLEPSLLK